MTDADCVRGACDEAATLRRNVVVGQSDATVAAANRVREMLPGGERGRLARVHVNVPDSNPQRVQQTILHSICEFGGAGAPVASPHSVRHA